MSDASPSASASVKPIVLSGHAKEKIAVRGVSESEVVEAIRTATWVPAERGRLECRQNLPFDEEWHGKRYATKQVRPVFVDEPESIVVVTVYANYF